MATTPHVANTVSSTLSSSAYLHTIVLYGSAARGELRTGGEMESDVDVAVAGTEPLSIGRRLELADLLADALDRKVDLVDLHRMHGLILKEILTTGVFLRKQRPEFVAAKMIEMYDYELFLAPQLRAARRERIRRFAAGERLGRART